jgi:hypothetical protein
MCDALAISLGTAALSTGAAVYEGNQAAAGIAATRDAQNAANAQWVAYQTKINQQQAQDEAAARDKATAAQQGTLAKVTPKAQESAQAAEQARLTTEYNQPGAGRGQDPSTTSNLLLSGQNSNAFNMSDLTKQVTQATAAARQRIGALATAGSYGGSFGGLGTTVPIAFQQGGNDINLQNAIRSGNLKTYGVQQQVQPLQYAVGPGTENAATIGKALGGLAGTAAGIGGSKALADSGWLNDAVPTAITPMDQIAPINVVGGITQY